MLSKAGQYLHLSEILKKWKLRQECIQGMPKRMMSGRGTPIAGEGGGGGGGGGEKGVRSQLLPIIFNNYSDYIQQLSIVIANSALRASLAITISYPTSASGIIALLITPKRIAIFELPSCFRPRVSATIFVVNGI